MLSFWFPGVWRHLPAVHHRKREEDSFRRQRLPGEARSAKLDLPSETGRAPESECKGSDPSRLCETLALQRHVDYLLNGTR